MAPSDKQNEMSFASKVARYSLGGAVCATTAHTVTVPFDVIKTRMQSQPGMYKSLYSAFATVAKAEGPGALLLGLLPTVVGYSLQGAFKFGGFELFKSLAVKHLGEDTASKHRLGVYLASSAMAETLASVALSPFEAVRIRVVTRPEYARLGSIGATMRIIREEGAAHGLFKGLPPLLFKQLPYTVFQLTTFQATTDYVYQHLLPAHYQNNLAVTLSVTASCGVLAGVVGSLASHPADTLLTRLNMDKTATLLGAMRQLGMKGLWLGAGARCVMVGLLSSIMFLINDSVKVAVGLPIASAIKKQEVAVPITAPAAAATAATVA